MDGWLSFQAELWRWPGEAAWFGSYVLPIKKAVRGRVTRGR